MTHNNVGFNFKLFPEVKLSGGELETVFKYKNGNFVWEIARIKIALPKEEGSLYNLRGLDFKGCFFSGQNFSNYDIQYVNWERHCLMLILRVFLMCLMTIRVMINY